MAIAPFSLILLQSEWLGCRTYIELGQLFEVVSDCESSLIVNVVSPWMVDILYGCRA
jgi:hypothetical protein